MPTIWASLEETLRLIRAFRMIQSEESRLNIILIAEAAAEGDDVKREAPPPPDSRLN